MQPLKLAGAAFGAGALLGVSVDLHSIRPLLALASLTIGVAVVASMERPRLARALAAVAFFAGGSALPESDLHLPSPPPGLYRLEVRTHEVDHGAHASWVNATAVWGQRVEDGLSIAAGSRLRLRGSVAPGARARLLARLEPVTRFRNRSPAAARPELPAEARGRIIGEAETVSVSGWAAAVDRTRQSVRAHLETTLSPGAAGMARALVLGDRLAVDELRREAVRGAGLAHVLAVSGLHVAVTIGLFVSILAYALRRVSFLARRFATERAAFAVGIVAALLYAEVAGAAPSARRAAITAALAFGLRALGRRPAPVPLAIAAISVLASLNPDELRDPGLLLSVVATLAVVTAGARGAAPDALWSRLRALAIVSFRATIATAPMIWWWFGAVPLVGLVANVALAPLASALLVPLALLHATVGASGDLPSAITGPLFEHVELAFSTTCALFSKVPWGRDLPPPTPSQVLIASVGALAVLFVRGWRRALLALLTTFSLLVGAEVLLRTTDRPSDEMRVTFVDVGQGDAVLIDAPDGSTLLIDGGGGSARPGRRALLPLLRARRCSSLALAVLTHPHPDHYEGLSDLVGRVPMKELWDSGQGPAEEPDGPVARLLEEARAEGTMIRDPGDLCGLTRRFGEAELRVLAPCPRYDAGYDPNDNSLVLALRYRERSFLFTGDAEAHQESMLAALGPEIVADVLKVAHHGSRTSSTAPFLAAVSPSLSVVSAGVHNRYGHPHDEVYTRLARAGRVLTTPRDGGITVITNGRTLEVRPFHGPSFSLFSP
jgi:competence protein ComEC